MHYRLFFDKGKRCSFTSDHYNVFIISMDGTTFHIAIGMSRNKSKNCDASRLICKLPAEINLVQLSF